MIGSKLLLFINNIDNVVKFLEREFHQTPTLKHLCDGLNLWKCITPFLVISVIEDEVKYKKEMLEFDKNVANFYESGKHSFLTKKASQPGDDETFYMHCLQFYIPQIAKTTFEEYNLGIGIFTMQGFERRNKESKNVMRKYCNYKGNIVQSNLKRLYDVYIRKT